MTKIGDLSVNIGIEVSEETVQRCCQLLQMYLEDHPERIVKTEWRNYYGDEEHPTVYIDSRETGSEDKK
jgi:hypothetical protein